MLPTVLPADSHQPGELRLVHLLRQPRREVVEIAGVARPAARPLDVLGQIARRPGQYSRLRRHSIAHRTPPHVEMAPAA